jgi:hypothetical protein
MPALSVQRNAVHSLTRFECPQLRLSSAVRRSQLCNVPRGTGVEDASTTSLAHVIVCLGRRSSRD